MREGGVCVGVGVCGAVCVCLMTEACEAVLGVAGNNLI